MIPKSRFIAVYILLICACLYTNLHQDIKVPLNRSFTQFPVRIDAWQMTSDEEFSQRVLDVLRPTDYLSREYRSVDGRRVGLYVGYHGGGKGTGGIHSPRHCLPGSGWFEESSRRESLDLPTGRIHLVQAVYRKGEHREMFLYWFQVQGATLSDEYSLKLAEIKNSMLERRRDSTFIRVSVPVEQDLRDSYLQGEKFIRDFYPVIRQFLP